MPTRHQPTEQAVPTLADVLEFIHADLELRTYDSGVEGVFDLLGKGICGPLLVRCRYDVLADVPVLAVEARCIVMLDEQADPVRRFFQRENTIAPLGSWHLDADGELYFRCQSFLAFDQWKPQVFNLLGHRTWCCVSRFGSSSRHRV